MPTSILALIFGFLVVILAFMRQRLVYELSGASLLLLGSTKPGIWLYTLFFLPGTIIHELSHWLVAEILQVKTGEIKIFPDWEDDGGTRRLGSVATARSDPLRGFLIGIAPFVTGLLILTILGELLSRGWGVFYPWQTGLIIYGIIVIGNSMMISEADRRTWPFIFFFLALISIVIYRMQPTISPSISLLASNTLSKLDLVLGVTAGLNLVMIGGLYLLRVLSERISGKRISHK